MNASDHPTPDDNHTPGEDDTPADGTPSEVADAAEPKAAAATPNDGEDTAGVDTTGEDSDLVDVGALAQAQIRKAAQRARERAIANAVNKTVKALLDSGQLEALNAQVAEAVFAQFGVDPAAGTAAVQAQQQPEMLFASPDEFLRGFLIPVYHRQVADKGEHRWAAEWWRSAEAIARIEAMWRAFEFLRVHDPALGISVWFKDHADHHMSILLANTGTFITATDKNKAGDPLPYTPPPAGLFPPVGQEPTP